jgi:hypothetical protein
MNFNKYALVMFAFVGVVSIMMGLSSSSYAQENQTSTTPSTGSSNQTSTTPSTGSSNQTSITSSNPTTPTADKNNSSSMSSANSASPHAISKNASGPMDMIKNLFKSFMGGNK